MSTTKEVRERVLLTGGTGFIASHVLDCLLEHGFQVTVTTRSTEKGRLMLEAADPRFRGDIDYAVVGDVASDGAFNHIFQAHKAFDYVIHTASPYHLNVKDPVRDFLDPAIKGTTGILKSISAHAPTVKRVVLTSSSAAMVNPLNPPPVYDESSWAPWTWEDALQDPQRAYVASKVLSERAAWEFVQAQPRPSFDLAVINNTYTFGPLQRTLADLDAMNTSNHRIRDMFLGRMKDGLEPTAPVFTFVDVRDVALAHVRAMTVPEAGGKRFYVVGGHFSNKQIADIIGDKFSGCRSGLPDGTVDDIPDNVMQFNNSRSREVLGLTYRGLWESVVDTASSIDELRRRNRGA